MLTIRSYSVMINLKPNLKFFLTLKFSSVFLINTDHSLGFQLVSAVHNVLSVMCRVRRNQNLMKKVSR